MPEESQVRYVPRRKLRSVGAYYSVYEAIQSGLERPVELRVLNVRFQPGSAEVERFCQEFRTIAQLDHSGIARVLDLGVMADHVFYVTDLRNSRSLQELLSQGRIFSPEDVMTLGQSIASALAAMHERQILHRDISTRTIWMDLDTGRPYVAEFSMVKNMSSSGLTERGIPYMVQLTRTPETMLAVPYDHRTDIYQLGSVLYQLLTRKDPPWPTDATQPAPSDELAHPRLINPMCPGELDGVIAKALAWNPENRYQTAREMSQDIDKAAVKGQMRAAASRVIEDSSISTTKRADVTSTLILARPRRKEPAPPPPPGTRTRAMRVMDVVKTNTPLVVAMGAMLFVVAFVGVAMSVRPPTAGSVAAGPRNDTHHATGPHHSRTAGTVTASSTGATGVAGDSVDFAGQVRKVVSSMSGEPTTKENFHQRWYLLDNWLKQVQAEGKPLPFSAGDLVNVRINFYRDEKEAGEKLDALYQKASEKLP